MEISSAVMIQKSETEIWTTINHHYSCQIDMVSFTDRQRANIDIWGWIMQLMQLSIIDSDLLELCLTAVSTVPTWLWRLRHNLLIQHINDDHDDDAGHENDDGEDDDFRWLLISVALSKELCGWIFTLVAFVCPFPTVYFQIVWLFPSTCFQIV